jgi:hypothetical protein
MSSSTKRVRLAKAAVEEAVAVVVAEEAAAVADMAAAVVVEAEAVAGEAADVGEAVEVGEAVVIDRVLTGKAERVFFLSSARAPVFTTTLWTGAGRSHLQHFSNRTTSRIALPCDLIPRFLAYLLLSS